MSNKSKNKYRCKKIKAGKYEYRGLIISRFGYHQPDKKVCWEGFDPKTFNTDFHGYSKRQVKKLIDDSFESKL